MKEKLLKTMRVLLVAALLGVGASASWAGDKAVVSYSFNNALSPSLTAGTRTTLDYSHTSVISNTVFLNAFDNGNNTNGDTNIPLSSGTTLNAETWTLEFDWAGLVGGNNKGGYTKLMAGETTLFTISDAASYAEKMTLSYGASGTADITLPNTSKEVRMSASTGDALNSVSYWYHFTITGDPTNGVKLTINSYTKQDEKTVLGAAVVSNVVLSETNLTPSSAVLRPGTLGAVAIDELLLSYYVEGEVIQTPIASITAVDGVNRTVTATCDTEGATLYYSLNNADWTEGASCVVSASGNVYFKATKNESESDVLTYPVTAGSVEPLANPSIRMTTNPSVNQYGGDYLSAPTFTIYEPDNSSVLLTPDTETLSYTFTPNGGAESSRTVISSGTTYTPTAYGVLTIYANTDGYGESSYSIPVSNAYYVSYTSSDYSTASTTSLGGTWGEDNTTKTDYGWPEGLTYNTFSNPGDVERINIQNSGTVSLVSGYGLVRFGSGYTYRARYSNKGDVHVWLTNTSKGASAESNSTRFTLATSGTGAVGNVTSQSMSGNETIKQLKFYTPTLNPIDAAIADCKTYETSAAFATYIDGGSFASAAQVYSAYTAWQVAQAKASGSTDLTKLIRNAAVTSTDDWGGSRVITLNEQYTGAPDNIFIDANNQTLNTNQTIYGVPAGTYTIKAATRAAEGVEGTLYVNDGTSDVGKVNQITNVGNTGGDLGNGWSWSEMTFTLTETKDLLIGFWTDATGKWAGCDDWHMTLVGETLPVSTAGFATNVSTYNLDFSTTDTKAYLVKVNNKGVATLSQIDEVPAGTPVLLHKEGGASEAIPVIASAAAVDAADNDLVAGTGATVATTDGDYTNMILNNVSGIGFYFANGQTVAANRAYLHILTTLAPDAANSRMVMVFDGETTGVSDATLKNNGESIKNGEVYDLQGRKVTNPTKGLYIVNGMKVNFNK